MLPARYDDDDDDDDIWVKESDVERLKTPMDS